jgi:hypothetical protein
VGGHIPQSSRESSRRWTLKLETSNPKDVPSASDDMHNKSEVLMNRCRVSMISYFSFFGILSASADAILSESYCEKSDQSNLLGTGQNDSHLHASQSHLVCVCLSLCTHLVSQRLRNIIRDRSNLSASKPSLPLVA